MIFSYVERPVKCSNSLEPMYFLAIAFPEFLNLKQILLSWWGWGREVFLDETKSEPTFGSFHLELNLPCSLRNITDLEEAPSVLISLVSLLIKDAPKNKGLVV